MIWQILLYESTRHERPVEEFIKTLEKSTAPKVAHVLDLLETHGSFLRMPYSKKLTRRIYELRIRGVEEIRILYSFGKKGEIYLLHGFKKKTQKTPRKEIIIAQDRLDSI